MTITSIKLCNFTVEQLRAELAAEREKVKELSTWLNDMEAEAKDFAFQVERKTEQLAAAQATIAQMREALVAAGKNGVDDFIAAGCLQMADRSVNLDALHEVRARECERLKANYPDSLDDEREAVQLWLNEQAAAHRARKEGK